MFPEDEVFGLWPLVAERSAGAHATTAQERAARFVVGDMPTAAVVSFDAAHELLCVRAYIIGLLASLSRKKIHAHPREAMRIVFTAVVENEELLKSIIRWNQRRYSQDPGPARVGATAHAELLGKLVAESCRKRVPTLNEARRVAMDAVREAGLGMLLDAQRVRIVYDGPGERTTREISRLELTSRWPSWAAYLLEPYAFHTLDAFCHLRNEARTFNLRRIVSITSA